MSSLPGTRVTRRQLIWRGLGFGAALAATSVLGACAGAPEPTATSAPQPTKAPAAAATQPPATAAPTQAPAATTAPAATAAPKPTTAPAATAAATAAPKASGPVTLQVTNVEAYSPEDDKKVFPVGYDIFSKQNNGQIIVKETILPENAQYYIKLLTMVAGGTPPDAVYIQPSNGLAQFAGQKVIVPLDDYIKADPTVNFDDFIKGPLTYYEHPLGGKLYGLPWYSGPSISLFNKKVFEKYGVKTPDQYEKEGKWTWDTLIEIGQKMTQGTGADKTFGYQSVYSGIEYSWGMIWEYGGDLWNSDMSHTLLGEGGAAQALDLYASIQYKYKMVPSASEVAGLPGGFLAGRTAMRYGIKGHIPAIRDAAAQGKLDPGMAPHPKGPKGRFLQNGPNSFCIMTASQHKDEGWKLVNFMTQKEFQGLQNLIGASVPVRKSILTSGEFAKSLQPWENLDVYVEASNLDRTPQLTPNHADIQAAFTAEFDLVKLGQKSFKDAAAKFVPAIDALLKKSKETWG